MKKLEMFFDYNCPFCLKGYDQLVDFLADKPEVQVIWHPCQIDVYKNKFTNLKTDISLQGMYYAADSNIDIWQYHQRVYDLIFEKRAYTQNIDNFANYFDGLMDVEAFKNVLKSEKYENKLKESNLYAFKTTGVHVVPTYRADDGKLQDRQQFFNMGPTDTGY